MNSMLRLHGSQRKETFAGEFITSIAGVMPIRVRICSEGAAKDQAFRAGIVTTTLVPFPSSLSTAMEPPCSLMNSLA